MVSQLSFSITRPILTLMNKIYHATKQTQFILFKVTIWHAFTIEIALVYASLWSGAHINATTNFSYSNTQQPTANQCHSLYSCVTMLYFPVHSLTLMRTRWILHAYHSSQDRHNGTSQQQMICMYAMKDKVVCLGYLSSTDYRSA